MRQIPKEILDRCTFTDTQHDEHNTRITAIKPIDPCPCGRKLDDTRRIRLAKTKEPQPHYREYCHTCKLVSVLDHNTWMKPAELNAQMRRVNFFKDK